MGRNALCVAAVAAPTDRRCRARCCRCRANIAFQRREGERASEAECMGGRTGASERASGWVDGHRRSDGPTRAKDGHNLTHSLRTSYVPRCSTEVSSAPPARPTRPAATANSGTIYVAAQHGRRWLRNATQRAADRPTDRPTACLAKALERRRCCRAWPRCLLAPDLAGSLVRSVGGSERPS